MELVETIDQMMDRSSNAINTKLNLLDDQMTVMNDLSMPQLNKGEDEIGFRNQASLETFDNKLP
jgi:hypothetical protein